MKPTITVLCRHGVCGKTAVRIAAAVVITFLLASPSPGQLVNGRVITSVYSWEKFDTVGVSKKITRGYLSGILDLGQNNWSFHTYVQGAADQTESPDYRLFYLYAKVKDVAGFADLTLGRLPYFAGVGIGTVDGAQATLRFDRNAYKVTLYGGANTPSDMTVKGYGSLNNRFVVGGQFIMAAVPDLRATVSYVNRRRERESYWTMRPDPSTESLPMFITPPPEEEEYAGADVSYRLENARFYGRYDYDLNLQKTQRGQFGVRYTFSPKLFGTADYIYRSPRIPYNSIFSVFNYKSVTEYEAGVDYYLVPNLRTFVRGAYVQYSGDHSFRYTVGIGREDVELSYRGNTGYAGELNSVTLQGAYPLFENRIVPNAAVSYQRYRLEANADAHSAVAAALGTTLRFYQAVSLDLQGQWVNNFVVKSDFRFFGKINYWFSEHLNLFE